MFHPPYCQAWNRFIAMARSSARIRGRSRVGAATANASASDRNFTRAWDGTRTLSRAYASARSWRSIGINT